MNLQTTLELPTSRETILHFCETVQKEFPAMTSFYRRETGEFVLEGERESGCYPWLELGKQSLSAGYFNPPAVSDAYRLHRWLLERSVYFLGISAMDMDALDVLFGFNLIYQGNRDAIVARSLLAGSPLAALAADGAPAVECEPSFVIALDEACSLQARLSVENRGSSYQVRTGQYDDEPISVYLAVRQYPTPGQLINLNDAFARQRELCEDLACRYVIPQIIRPIATAIAADG